MAIKKTFGILEFIVVLLVASVLYIIVMKGKDIIISAQTVKVTRTFMEEWVSVLRNYKEITGHNIYATVAKPNINSVQTNSNLSAPRQCYEFEILKEFVKTGIDLKEKLATNDSVCRNFIEGKSITEPMSVAFGAMRIGKEKGYIKNVLIFNNVPMDVAKRFDRYVDGKADGTSGAVISDGKSHIRRISLEKISGNEPYKAWEPQPWSEDDALVTTVYVLLENY